MSRVDEVIYVARPDLIELKGEGFNDLAESLARDAAEATAITILGGYFNSEEVIEFCLDVPAKPKARRQHCRVRIAVGLDRYNGMTEVWEKLSDVQEILRREGFRDLNIGVIPPFRFISTQKSSVSSRQPPLSGTLARRILAALGMS